MICLREHDFWNYFFLVEHVSRFISPIKNPHPEPFWFFFPLIVGGALPWSVLFPAVLPRLSSLIRQDSFIRFALCWFLFPFLFFSASHCKLATYILPCYPPLVILITVGLMNYFETTQHKVFNTVALCLSALIGSTAAALIVNQLTGWPGFSSYGPEETWKWILTACGLMVWSLLLLLVTKMPDYRRKIILFCAAPLVCMFSSHFILPNEVKIMKAPSAFLLRHSEKVTPETILISDKRLVSSVCWFYKRNDVLLIDKGEFEYGLSFEDAKDRQLTIDGLGDLYDKESGKKGIVLIISKKLYTKYEHLFPKAAFKDLSGTMVFIQFQKQISS
jgi:4-amino-4-deoxy-L-arabinose transferase